MRHQADEETVDANKVIDHLSDRGNHPQIGALAAPEIPEAGMLDLRRDIDFASAAVIPLSSIRQPAYMMGESAFDLLIDETRALLQGEIPGPRRVVFGPKLVVRNSTRG